MRPIHDGPSYAFISTTTAALVLVTIITLSVHVDRTAAKPISMYDELVSGSRAFLRMVELLGSADYDDDESAGSYDATGDFVDRQQNVDGDGVVANASGTGGTRNKPSRSTAAASGSTAQERCQQPVRKGVCRALIPRWSYDMASKECREFKFGGCDGNGNNFASLRQCQDMCAGL